MADVWLNFKRDNFLSTWLLPKHASLFLQRSILLSPSHRFIGVLTQNGVNYIVAIESGFRRIWRIKLITLSEIRLILHILQKPNSLIALLFIKIFSNS